MREDIVKLIKMLHVEMEQLTVDAGVSPETYESIILFDESTPDVELEALYTWLQILFEKTYLEVVKVWKLHPKSRWNYYYSMGEELTEIRLLNKLRRKLHEEWRKPYKVSRHKKSPERLCIRSEEAGTDGRHC